MVTAGILDIAVKESEAGGEVSNPSLGQDLRVQSPGKGLVGRTDDLAAAGG